MKRRIEIIEHKALMGQLPKRWCQFLADSISGKPFRRHKDHVITLERSRIFILIGGRLAVKILTEPGNIIVGGIGRQRLQIYIHHIGRGIRIGKQ